jgi:predicted RNA-binding protein (TIGR00451 family)
MMPRIQVDKGAIKFILSGANVMTPGILSAGGAIIVDLPEGAPVAVYAEGKEHALALGIMLMSTEDMYVDCSMGVCVPSKLVPRVLCSRTKRKGAAIEVIHHLDDML